jgi:two-component system LytT family sensor kinase
MKWRRELISSVLIFVAGACTQYLVFCRECLETYEGIVGELVFAGLLWLMLWKASVFSVNLLDRYSVGWVKAPLQRFIYSVATIVAVAIASYFLIYLTITVFFLDWDFMSSIQSVDFEDYIMPVIITLVINGFMHGRGFLFNLRQKSIDNERLKTEQVASQLNSLRDQVNPHFLFNSLNALSSLVYEDQKKAVMFIRKLSEVYRYVLDQNDKELVSVAEEMEFMESYFFLLDIRFGENLVVDLSKLQDQCKKKMIPPMSLQLLVENAIKHNVVSESKKLTIEIFNTESSFLVVRNNMSPKKSLHSKGIGLQNLRQRYQFLSDKQVVINQTEKVFEVYLPLLEIS